VWKSNPPFDPRRAESPALKAGKVTGPLSPPQSEYHHRNKLTGTPQDREQIVVEETPDTDLAAEDLALVLLAPQAVPNIFDSFHPIIA